MTHTYRLDVLHTATDRVILVHWRDGHQTSRYALPVFPRTMRLVYEQLHYTIRDVPYHVPQPSNT
jgi:hypothetical protein